MVHSATLLSIDRAERLAAAGPPTTPDPRAPRGKCPRLAAWPGNEAKQRSLMICMYMAGPDGKGVYNYSSLDALEVKVCPLYIYIYIMLACGGWCLSTCSRFTELGSIHLANLILIDPWRLEVCHWPSIRESCRKSVGLPKKTTFPTFFRSQPSDVGKVRIQSLLRRGPYGFLGLEHFL